MTSGATTVNEYLEQLPVDRQAALQTLRQTILSNLPAGFSEQMSYGMPGYVVPHTVYPAGYHCDPTQPVPFVSFASQKNFVALYHMGLYANPILLQWFTAAYPQYAKGKLDMGKSCIRFKKPENIPFELIGELMKKMTMEEWIDIYEANVKK